jgi:hypothetical protein
VATLAPSPHQTSCPRTGCGSAGGQPERNAWSPLQGKHSDFCKNTFEVLLSIATQCTTSYEAVVLY